MPWSSATARRACVSVLTGVGPVRITALRVNDRRVVGDARQKFTSAVLPPACADRRGWRVYCRSTQTPAGGARTASSGASAGRGDEREGVTDDRDDSKVQESQGKRLRQARPRARGDPE